MKIRIGTRASDLALTQANYIKEKLESFDPNIEVEICEVITEGDCKQNVSLAKIGGKGLFVEALEEKLASGILDMAVHSLKDVPAASSPDFPLIAYSEREDPRDVLIVKEGLEESEIKLIGTSSPRRQAALKSLFPKAVCKPLRGNVPKRLKKLEEENYDAIVLAKAGLDRLGLKPKNSRVFTIDEMVPAAGQASLGIQVHKDIEQEKRSLIERVFFNDEIFYVGEVERSFIRELEGSCTTAAGAYVAPVDGGCFEGWFFYEKEGGPVQAYTIGTREEVHDFALKMGRAWRKSINGHVDLVGAGPGDPKHLTLAGFDALQRAEVILIDALVSPEISDFFPEDAEVIFVGKRSGKHYMKQEETTGLLLKKLAEGKRVVRLKGGDSYVFGRGGEEALAVAKAGFSFEVIPGITSAIAAPMFAGIPVTHRGLARSCTFITARRFGEGAEEADYKLWASLLPNTLVFMMSTSLRVEIAERLIAAGAPPDTPCATIFQGTYPSQKSWSGSLEELVKGGDKNIVQTPGMLVVGEVASLAEKLNFVKKRPLYGASAVIPILRGKPSKLKKILMEAGAATTSIPVADLKVLGLAESFAPPYGAYIFTSVAGVNAFKQNLKSKKTDIRSLGKGQIYAVGRRTREALEEIGLFNGIIGEEETGASLAKRIIDDVYKGRLEKGKKLAVIIAEGVESDLVKSLEDTEIDFELYEIYRTVERGKEEEIVIEASNNDSGGKYFFFTSYKMAKGLLEKVDFDLEKDMAICIGPSSEKLAKELALPYLVSEECLVESMVDTMIKNYKKRMDIN
ncbi:MAG: hydroxymethylbilane synthase [Tissierellia bacterium]|nr:hydroxymethylbilane synthase [Tissierellia bacterium]